MNQNSAIVDCTEVQLHRKYRYRPFEEKARLRVTFSTMERSRREKELWKFRLSHRRTNLVRLPHIF